MKNSFDSSMIDIKRTKGELRKIRNTESKIRINTGNKIYNSTNYLLILILINRKFVISGFVNLQFQIN